jgi:hypothetical protein
MVNHVVTADINITVLEDKDKEKFYLDGPIKKIIYRFANGRLETSKAKI